ncbi:MAG: hypothetical protein QNJ97_17915 [Myxococcota bacterium]|nr:hypothetical protein [Myxococcota bacterium]
MGEMEYNVEKLVPMETITLQVNEFYSQAIVDVDLSRAEHPWGEVEMRYLAEKKAHEIYASFRPLGDVLQDNTVVAAWPITLWDHIKLALNHLIEKFPKDFWRHDNPPKLRVHMKLLRMHEIVVFPDIDYPNTREMGRKFVFAKPRTVDTREWTDEEHKDNPLL